MIPQSHDFKRAASKALADRTLQEAMRRLDDKFPAKRAEAVAKLPEFEALRDTAARIKDHTLAHLDLYLERFAAQVERQGGQVHWARNAQDARTIVIGLARKADAKTVTKGKSMIGEEIGINAALQAAGIVPVETDLGEYILQLAGEAPSHIIGPALHKTKGQVAELFLKHHGGETAWEEGEDLVAEARKILRERYFAADMGITGANFLIAETGQTVIVTNEGNGDLTQSLPKAHIVLASIDKVVPTLEDTSVLLRLLGRSATGQEMSAYTTFSAGPRRDGDADGPAAFHVVVIDNGRSALLGTPAQQVLRCIRCGACMNHCPVYQTVGGHAYGWVYPGPIGAALDPALIGLKEARHLPQASSLCGACEAVCPVKIELPMIFRYWREQAYDRGLSPWSERQGVRLWGVLLRRPRLYRAGLSLLRRILALAARGDAARHFPIRSGWSRRRDIVEPEGGTFFERWGRGER